MKYFFRIALMISALFTASAFASDNYVTQSKSVIDGMMEKSLAIVNNDETNAVDKRKVLKELVDVYFDFDLVSELTLSKFSATSKKKLGKYSNRRLTPQQQIEFTVQLKEHLSNLYLDSLDDSTRLTAEVGKASALKKSRGMERARVMSVINDLTPIDYSMRLKDDNWKIYDVRVEGRSLVASFRKEYNALLLKNTPDELIKLLTEKNKAHNE